MLILSRKKGESIKIGDDIEIFVTEVKGDKVYLTVENNKEASDKVDLLKVFQLSRNLRAMTAEEEEEKQEENHGDA